MPKFFCSLFMNQQVCCVVPLNIRNYIYANPVGMVTFFLLQQIIFGCEKVAQAINVSWFTPANKEMNVCAMYAM